MGVDRSTTDCRDAWVETPLGRLFARTWTPVQGFGALKVKEPIVLLHDSLGSVELWRTFPARLSAATGRRVVAYDRLGFGKSDPYRHHWSYDFIREEAERSLPALQQQLGFDGFALFGHSVGGGMAVHCAAAFRDTCTALMTESAQAMVEERTLQGILDAKKVFQSAEQFDRLKKYHGEKAEWVLNAWTETWLAPEFAEWSLEAVLPGVQCRVLVIHGEDDEYASLQQPQMIGALVSAPSQIEILPGCRHVPHREQEETVVTLVANFLG